MLKNKVAIVTGAAKGNGFGISKVLLQKGATVIMTDISPSVEASCEELKKEVQSDQAFAYQMDVTHFKMVNDVVEKIIEKWGNIDILVNNAGISLLTDIKTMDDEMRDRHMNVNVNGAWNCVKAILPHMMDKRYGRIVNISSVTGNLVCDPQNISYAMSKSALIGFTKAIAIDTADHNITCNAIMPGYFLTPMVEMTARETNPEHPEKVLKEIAQGVPIGRLGRPEEIGYLAAFLASDEASYITGQQFVIDGGSTLPETVSVGR